MRNLIKRQHLQFAFIIQIEANICENRDKIIKIVRQRLTVLDYNTSILSICEIIFAQIRPSNKNVGIKDMRFDMMNSKYFS